MLKKILLTFICLSIFTNICFAVQEKNTEDFLKTGQALFLNEQYDLALKALNKAIELNPGNAWAYLHRGDVYEKQNEYK